MDEYMIKKADLNKEVGNRIREMREYQELTREKLAEYADISVQFLASIEAGQKSMTTHTIYKMAKALNVSMDYLVTGNTTSSGDSKISLLLETLPDNEKQTAERLLQIYLRGLTQRETSVTQKLSQ